MSCTQIRNLLPVRYNGIRMCLYVKRLCFGYREPFIMFKIDTYVMRLQFSKSFTIIFVL